MVATKATGLEIAVGPDSGVLYKKAGAGRMPRDFITWQDLYEFRIWIHSRETSQGYKPVSLEVQLLGNHRSKKGVEPAEAQARANLASLVNVDTENARIGHADLRGLPMGRLLEMNSILVSSEQARALQGNERKLKLVEHEKEEFRKLYIPVPQKSASRGFNPEIRASKEDSILIAFIYAQLSSTGNKRAARHTAEMLNIDPKFVYTAVRNARKKSWLTSEGLGSAGGELTNEGIEEFERSGGRQRYEEFLRNMMKGNR
jgi:hypothetical protein